MEQRKRLIESYLLSAGDGFALESLVATTYKVDFEFFEEDLLANALGVRSPGSRQKASRSELERRLQEAEVSVLYDPSTCDRPPRRSPRIDANPITARKLHSKVTLLMWVRKDPSGEAPPDRRIRLIVGSANLTRQGFRQNYECVACVDYGGKSAPPRHLLTKAIGLVREIASSESQGPQLSRQLAEFEAQAALFPAGAQEADAPVALADGMSTVREIRSCWDRMSNTAPDKVTIVSPFWTEGSTAVDGLVELFQQLGSPRSVEMICSGWSDGTTWRPVFDKNLAVDLKSRLGVRLYLRAALPELRVGSNADDPGDESEEKEFASRRETADAAGAEVVRPLHAKMILVEGEAGSVLYVGSSNCTRRGLGLGGVCNFEAGFVYRLTTRQRKHVSGLFAFAGPPVEVRAGDVPLTSQPLPVSGGMFVPRFLSEVTAHGTAITVRFRETIPADLVLLMPIPGRSGETGYLLLFQADPRSEPSVDSISVDLGACPRCDEHAESLPADASGPHVSPNVYVEVRWEGHSATYPVRFDDKGDLPLLLAGRGATEGELIEYFLSGNEPAVWEEENSLPAGDPKAVTKDGPVDTRRILAYFIRRFVQAIPGMEAEIRRAGYSRAPLDAVLRGPTSPRALAEHVYASLTRAPAPDGPAKTPIAVGFQLTEILAAVLRCQSAVIDSGLKECFQPVVTRCREMLGILASEHAELRTDGFSLYQTRILGVTK